VPKKWVFPYIGSRSAAHSLSEYQASPLGFSLGACFVGQGFRYPRAKPVRSWRVGLTPGPLLGSERGEVPGSEGLAIPPVPSIEPSITEFSAVFLVPPFVGALLGLVTDVPSRHR